MQARSVSGLVELWLLLTLALGAVLTAALVVPMPYHFSRLVSWVQLGVMQKALVVCYSMTLYSAVALPFSAVLSLGAYLVAPRLALSPRPILKRVLLTLLLAPVFASVIAFIFELPGTRTALTHAKSDTEQDLNVVLIVVDTLRADHLGSYGYELETSPYLDSLAAEGVRFSRCHTTAAWTKPSVASILTSVYPAAHGANQFRHQLPEDLTTIAELMRDAGFVTYAYVTNPHLKSIFLFDQGFQFFDDYLIRDKLYLVAFRELPIVAQVIKDLTGLPFGYRYADDSREATSRILRWVERYHDESFFMYLHYMDPHAPYSPPPPYDGMFGATKMARYDGEIRFLDDNLAALMDRFRQLGIFDKTLFIITADHGEAFGEHGDWGHDRSVYQEQLHVPLIVTYAAESLSGVVDTAVQTTDIAPTILDFAGVEAPPAMVGRSLRQLMHRQSGKPADIFVDHTSATGDARFHSVIVDGRHKYIHTLEGRPQNASVLGDEEVYDLLSDPFELSNLVAQDHGLAASLRELCAAYVNDSSRRASPPSVVEELDDETESQLRALGYID